MICNASLGAFIEEPDAAQCLAKITLIRQLFQHGRPKQLRAAVKIRKALVIYHHHCLPASRIHLNQTMSAFSLLSIELKLNAIYFVLTVLQRQPIKQNNSCKLQTTNTKVMDGTVDQFDI